MSEGWQLIGQPSAGGVLIVVDHASNHVPADIDLGIDPALLNEHVAIDIGVAPLAAALCNRLGCAALLGGVSRLVIDLNREEDAAGLIPLVSDGHAIAGNEGVDRTARIARFWQPYHDALTTTIAAARPAMLVSLHSFTPRLKSSDEPRPWQVGVLYNQDARAARIAIPLLEAAGIVTGDNQPYSGTVLNATMNRHGEANGLPYLGLEVRQDLIGDATGVEQWCATLAPIIAKVAAAFH
ncbi:N-formylglutamate amidohydrolase [Sphingomonas jatrophae]|uniref:Predicted N-formylglutamate amidohydrolase n=1 Tax=Sphingomonas jatrophae TaxID=1166337 RepID=A0A1I6JEJ0_9SPHN|nr:N-formylglutamate amidohydrolase [Sphingomonas jatrophae]SFR77259.1 Predicted N-formylglutamate amidohydrolase [Sphingomonas jatrophae]